MPDDFYPFVDSGQPAPDNSHLQPTAAAAAPIEGAEQVAYPTRIAIYDDPFSTPRVVVIEPKDVRSYLEEVTNTVYRCMKEQGGTISLMVIREIVENFIHAHFVEPIISVLDDGCTIRFADQGPGIEDKERAFEFGITSADRGQKRYIRGTGAGFPLVQQYLEHAGGAISIEDNLNQGTVVTVSVAAARVAEIERAAARGAAVRGAAAPVAETAMAAGQVPQSNAVAPNQMPASAPVEQGSMAPAAYPYGSPATYGAVPAGYQPVPAGQTAWGYPPQPVGYPAQAPAGWNGYPAAYPPQGVPGAYPPQGMPAAGAYPAQQAPMAQGPAEPYVSERGVQALRYLAANGTGGPTDLTNAIGSSTATWSRELDTLTNAGLVIKHGQKRMLTEMGKIWIQSH